MRQCPREEATVPMLIMKARLPGLLLGTCFPDMSLVGIMIEAQQMSIVWLYCGALQCSALL